MLRRTVLAVSAVAFAVVVSVPLAPVTSVAAPASYCGIAWGSQEKSVFPTTRSELVGIRSGRHDCYDRLVFDTNGPIDGYLVSYVDQITEDATGRPIPVRGGARLAITIHAPAYDQSMADTYTPVDRAELVNTTGYETFRQAVWAGSWEGTTSAGLGVRARLPFRVFTLPGRVVIDVAHRW